MKKLLPLVISAALSGLYTTSALADTLAEIYSQAKENDPTLLNSAAQRDAAFEAINSSRSSLLPQINLTASYDLTRSDYEALGRSTRDSDRLAAGVSFSQELYNRSSWISLDTAEKTARRADSSYASAHQSLILRVAQANFDVLKAK